MAGVSPLLSSRVPYLRDGVIPAGSRIVCSRSERRFSVSVWVRYTGQFMVGPRASVCGVSARPVPQGVLPGGPRCVRELGLSLASSSVLHCPMLGFSVASATLAATRWSSLKLRVLAGSWFSPLCSLGRRSASRSTCSTLSPVSRLFFGLGAFSFG